MPQISVIVPVYKSQDYLEKCIMSILNQTFTDLELILIDDGSPDLCPTICDNYARNDNRVRVLHQSNSGVATARNRGLSVASGDFFTFVDSDDYIEPEMYEAMMKIVDEYNCDLVMCDCIKEFGERTEIYTHDIRPGYYDREKLQKEYFPHLLIMPNIEYPPTISNWLCLCRNRHSQLDVSLRYIEGVRYSEDLLFGAQMIYQANSFYYMKGRAFYHYNCLNQQSATHTFVSDKWNDFRILHRAIEDQFGQTSEYDFHDQIEKVLLFFVYNAVEDVLKTNSLTKEEKERLICNILNDQEVRQMFKRMRVLDLQIPAKLKLLTFCYKYRFGIKLLLKMKRN